MHVVINLFLFPWPLTQVRKFIISMYIIPAAILAIADRHFQDILFAFNIVWFALAPITVDEPLTSVAPEPDPAWSCCNSIQPQLSYA